MSKLDKTIVEQFVGIPWKEDGRDMSGMDCAGLMEGYYKAKGIKVEAPQAKAINASEEKIKEFMQKVVAENEVVGPDDRLEPEDLLIFKINDELHVGLYIGYEQMLHAYRGGKSRVSRMDRSWRKYFILAVRPKDGRLYIPPSGPPAVVAIGAVIADYAAASFVAGSLIALSWSTVFCLIGTAMIGYSIGLAMQQANRSKNVGSQRYSFGELQTTATNQAIIPIIYGRVRYAGNVVYQYPQDGGEEIDRIIVLCLGEIESVTDVRLNGEPFADFPGCSYRVFLGTPTQNVQTDTGLDLKGIQYRNIACLHVHLKISEKLNGGQVNVTCIIEARKVQTWDGAQWSTSRTWSRNPAACIRDYLLTKFNLGGCGYLSGDIGGASFGEVYDRCAEEVSDGDGGVETRFDLDYVIDQKRSASDNLSEMLVGLAGSLIRSGSTLDLIMAKPDIKMMELDEDDVTDLRVIPSGLDKKFNRFEIEYFDPTQNDVKIVVPSAEDKIDQDERGVVAQTLTIPSIIRRTHALRLANQYFYELKLCPIAIEFTADIKVIPLEIGRVFGLTHSLMAYAGKKFITQRIEESELDTYRITAQEYNPSIYNDSFGATIEVFDRGAPPNPYGSAGEVSGLLVSEGDYYIHKDGTVSSDILVDFSAPSGAGSQFLSHYQIELSKEGGAFRVVGTTTDTFFTIYGVEDERSYQVRIRTVSINHIISDGVTSDEMTVLGKLNPPSDPTGFEIYQEGNMLHARCDACPDVDYARSEIRKGGGGDWKKGTFVAEKFDSTELIFPIGEIGPQIFMIKHFDTSGNESRSPGIDQITIVPPPDMNFVNNFDRWSMPLGQVLSGLEIVQTTDHDTSFVRPCLALRTATTWEEREAEGKTWEQQEADGGLLLNGEVEATGYCEMVSPLDLGTILEVKLVVDADYRNVSGGSVSIQVSYSEDGITYTSYADIEADVSYRARYLKFKVILSTIDTQNNVYLYDLLVYVHAPSVKRSWFKDVLIPDTGKTLLFDAGFTITPRVTATIVNGVVGVVSLNNKTTEQVEVMVYGVPSGAAIGTAEIDVDAVGY